MALPRLTQTMAALTVALRTPIDGVNRAYPPSAANVIRDKPTERGSWDNTRGVLYFLWPGWVLGERHATQTEMNTALITVLAGRVASASRSRELSGVSEGSEPWAIKAQLAADVVNQLDAALRDAIIPGALVNNITYQVNFDPDTVSGWEVVQVLVEVSWSRDRGAA